MEVKFPMSVTGLKLKKAKVDKDGNVVDPAKIVVQIETPVDGMVMANLSRGFEQEGEAELWSYQAELPFIQARPSRIDTRTGEVAEG